MAITPYLTAAEVQACQLLHQRAPYSVTGISTSIFSVARHFGGMTYQGCKYTYMGSQFDECVRDDVLKLVTKLRQAGAKDVRSAAIAEFTRQEQELDL